VAGVDVVEPGQTIKPLQAVNDRPSALAGGRGGGYIRGVVERPALSRVLPALILMSACSSQAAPVPAPSEVAPIAPVAPAAAVAVESPVVVPAEPLNTKVLALLNGYRTGAANPYEWSKGMNTDGVSRDLFWQGVPLAGRDGGVHCSGITFEVYVQALEASLNGAPGPSAEELLAVKEDWYVRTGKDGGPVDGLATRGLGERIDDIKALRAGDFIQFWRNNGKGHSAVFIEHTRNRDGSIRGLVYWSAQGSSGGIGRRIASLGEDINQLNRLYGVRALRPALPSAG
jgi:hypothetical protein